MNVLITRAAEQLAETVNIFSSCGLRPYCMPMIQSIALEPPCFMFDSYDYCILTSPTAVRFFAPYGIPAAKYVAIGSATAAAVKQILKVSDEAISVPGSAYITEIEKFFSGMKLADKKILAPGGRERIKDVSDLFTAKGAYFDAPALYETAAVRYNKGTVETAIKRYRIDTVTFFSPSAVGAFFGQTALPDNIITAAIGRTTAESLSAMGYKPLCGSEQTAESLAKTLKELDQSGQ